MQLVFYSNSLSHPWSRLHGVTRLVEIPSIYIFAIFLPINLLFQYYESTFFFLLCYQVLFILLTFVALKSEDGKKRGLKKDSSETQPNLCHPHLKKIGGNSKIRKFRLLLIMHSKVVIGLASIFLTSIIKKKKEFCYLTTFLLYCNHQRSIVNPGFFR